MIELDKSWLFEKCKYPRKMKKKLKKIAKLLSDTMTDEKFIELCKEWKEKWLI